MQKGSFSYQPATPFHGLDTFTYQASDGAATSGVATRQHYDYKTSMTSRWP